ncbi:MAG: hypothetical protein HZC29_01105 [Thaumarchaeota archaeon]|nr:hypothetical protein [Nitrososphaerota archaeon]
MVYTEFEKYVMTRLDSLTENQNMTCQDLRELKTIVTSHLETEKAIREAKEKEFERKQNKLRNVIAILGIGIGSTSLYTFLSQFFKP